MVSNVRIIDWPHELKRHEITVIGAADHLLAPLRYPPSPERIEATFALPAFWRGAADARRELRRWYGHEYTEQQRLDDARAMLRLDRLIDHCRTHRPLASSKDYSEWRR